MAQAVSRRPPTTETGIRSRSKSCEISHSIFPASNNKPVLRTSRHLHAPLIGRTSGRNLENVKHSDAPPEIGSVGKKCSFLFTRFERSGDKITNYMHEKTQRKWKGADKPGIVFQVRLVIISYTSLIFMVVYWRYKFRFTKLFSVHAKQIYFSLAFA
jgi:hypothetical protein